MTLNSETFELKGLISRLKLCCVGHGFACLSFGSGFKIISLHTKNLFFCGNYDRTCYGFELSWYHSGDGSGKPMVDQIWCGAPWNLSPLRTLFESLVSGNLFQYKWLLPHTLGLRPEKCLLRWRILRLLAIIASTYLCLIMKCFSFDNCLTVSEAFLILLFLPWSDVLRQSDSSSKPQNVIAKNRCWETGFYCLLVSLKKKKKKVAQNIQGVKGDIFPTSSSTFPLYEVVNVKIRVINQSELFRFIIVNVHLCQAILCWFWRENNALYSLTTSVFCTSFAEQHQGRDGILVCAEPVLYK